MPIRALSVSARGVLVVWIEWRLGNVVEIVFRIEKLGILVEVRSRAKIVGKVTDGSTARVERGLERRMRVWRAEREFR